MIAALFDCDGTLYSAEMGRGMMKYASENGRQGLVRVYTASLFPRYWLSKLGLISREAFRLKAVSRQRWLIKSWDQEQAAAAFNWIVYNYLLPTQRADVVARLEEHRDQEHAVVLVSGMLEPCLALIGEHFQVAGIVGTVFEREDGRFTGRLTSPVMNGAHKATYIRAFFESQGINVDWPASYAYADSIHDQAMFDLVGHPVAVYPDPQLLDLAGRRDWEIIP
jgi:HAD superfamily hydrolase (TIGR01490 family)